MTLARLGAFLFVLICTLRVTAAEPEITPTDLPGAEARIYREGSSTAEALRLFVMKPSGWKEGDRRAALVFFFGGGWTTGTPANALTWAKFAADHGMVGIAPDYRTKGRANTSPLASVADSRAAVRWIQDHGKELGVDSACIVVGGNSAGGHVALWTAINAAPPGSSPNESPLLKPAALILFSTVSDTSLATGYTPQRFGDDASALSPVHQLDQRMPPTLAFHGDADKLVPLRQALTLRDAFKASGNVCELHIVPGGGHNFGNDVPEWNGKSRDLIVEFLQRYPIGRPILKPNAAALTTSRVASPP
jgi:acetyl esterase